MSSRPAKGGGRWVLVGPERLGRWVDGFVERHGPPSVTADGEVVRLRGADGAVAEFQVPFPPLTSSGGGPLARLISHARRERRVGVLLVRLGGHAAGIFQGEVLVSSKVGSRLVHGRSAAGGWSQRRFARRRENQAGQAYDAAAEVALRILGPQVAELEAVVLGGDRRAVDALRSDRRLAGVFALEVAPFLVVPDPRLVVLSGAPAQFRAVRVKVIDPG
ncbi:acVLRF1 family peptidyl-tRNA hydrolase [Streptosporangium sp. NBC_01639]|uniref:acVLRF1 family peptidyl-tRNA hydrolase n=1 Tax=unclassified Streptosporangium TaxID=2632669 RepID=UPI002DD960BC|nr:acVLRF1 family peptidyl-tRNA hydrolase [Streptosporangium sp. NBC_01756]WSC87117.1 acVLRF1 family peptidyl-tRNA hydrolase [Streptosporangium sp. NBC_01756]WTD54193.1 acVLRF1 family peptidyl-tRNA hydrolase [Streptosporangium sp. NBC_01639]